MFVESLESRRLLSASAAGSSWSGLLARVRELIRSHDWSSQKGNSADRPSATVEDGVLTVNGSNRDDTINVIEDEGGVLVELTVDGNLITRTFEDITAIRINGNGGGDTIFYTGNSIGADIHGDNAQASDDNGDDDDDDDDHHGKGKGHGYGHHKGRGKGHDKGRGKGHDRDRDRDGDNNVGRPGDDAITVRDEGTGASTIDGDAGNDDITVIVGNMTGLTTVVHGGSGSDVILLNTGVGLYPDIAEARTDVFAEEDDDTIIAYAGQNTIDGGAGFDEAANLGGTNTFANVEVIVP